MYPTISDLLRDIFGVNLPLPIQSFGFFVAVSFIIGAWLILLELKRKEAAGMIKSQIKEVIKGKPANPTELSIMALVGFVLGYKLLGIILDYHFFADNPQRYVFSGEGNIIGGIAGAAMLAYLRYREKQKQKLAKPMIEEVEVRPFELTGNIVMLGALFGILGAKIFHNLENIDDFMQDPVGALFSFSGLTFYGGLILAAAAIFWYAGSNKIPPLVIADVTAPAIMIAYAIGRIGCQTAGDGDWGILNSAYITTAETKVELAQGTQFGDTLQKNKAYYLDEFKAQDLKDIPHKTVKAPGWLPTWMVAYSYPHNVIRSGVEIPKGAHYRSYNPSHNYQLPVPVFPTPIYETVMCSLLFIILWLIRKRIKISGVLFSIFLMMNGVERFFIEKIRVNTQYHIFGSRVTQAEIISTLLFITGAVMLFLLLKKKKEVRQ